MINLSFDQTLLIFQKIIEQESKTSTYKFALLRAVIDLISAQSPHIEDRDTHVAIPVLLISHKWLFYYWDLIKHDYAQIHSERDLVFKEKLLKLQTEYCLQNYWDFNREFQKAIYTSTLKSDLVSLIKVLNDTIIKNPVKYIGTSIGEGYNALFQVEAGRTTRDAKGYLDLLKCSPKILMNKIHFEGLKTYGGLLSGTNSIIMNWVDFMHKQKMRAAEKVNQNDQVVSEILVEYAKPTALSILLKSSIIERETLAIRNFWSNRIISGTAVFCTWSGQQIKKTQELAIDHAIPFSVLFNNDYWNLVPAKKAINSSKSDKILSKEQIFSSKERVYNVWSTYQKTPELAAIFNTQCQISLVKSAEITLDFLYEKFIKINEGFVELRGMESWG